MCPSEKELEVAIKESDKDATPKTAAFFIKLYLLIFNIKSSTVINNHYLSNNDNDYHYQQSNHIVKSKCK